MRREELAGLIAVALERSTERLRAKGHETSGRMTFGRGTSCEG
jgi:hypothetical protein